MKTSQPDPTATNLAAYNNPRHIAEAITDAEDYMPYIFKHPIFTDFNASLPGRNVLDLGCGPGLMTKWYSDNGYHATGLDFAEGMIKVAKETCPKCHFITKNALDLTPTDGKLDGIVTLHLIQFLDKLQIADLFQKIGSHLSKDGKFLLVFTNTCHPKSGLNACSTGVSEYWNRWQLEDIAPLFEPAGLKLTRFEQPKLANGEEPFFFIAEKGQ